jgi:hypothetical protein
MKNPPIDWSDLLQFGVSPSAVIVCDGDRFDVQPQPPQFTRKLLAELAARPAPDGDRLAYMRHVRDLLLSLTDWTQVADSPPTESQREAWATYRQALRDLPQVYSGEGPIPWPVAP